MEQKFTTDIYLVGFADREDTKTQLTVARSSKFPCTFVVDGTDIQLVTCKVGQYSERKMAGILSGRDKKCRQFPR